MKKARKLLGNPERRSYHRQCNERKLVELDNAWLDGWFDSRLGTNTQSIDDPYKRSQHFEWIERSGFRYQYRKTEGFRRLYNAKAKKHRNKKYYRKARNKKGEGIQKPRCVVATAIYQEEEARLHDECVEFRGGYYATCKACELPMPHGAMVNSDMAICYDCAEGTEWIAWFFDDENYDDQEAENDGTELGTVA